MPRSLQVREFLTKAEEAKNDSVRVRDGYGEMLNLLSLKSHAGD